MYERKIPYRLFILLIIGSLSFIPTSCDIFDTKEPTKPSHPCENGLAGETYPCNQIDLMAHLTPEELGGKRLNDIWGWTDPQSGRRYALVGIDSGVSIVDISMPDVPRVDAIIPSNADTGHSDHDHSNSIQSIDPSSKLRHGASFWGDIKVYRNYLYAVSEGNNHGLHIFDLTRLRQDQPEDKKVTVDTIYDGFGSAHNIYINTETGYGYAVGTDRKTCSESGLHIINLQDPDHPKFAGCYSETGYIHDTQCVIYRGLDPEYRGKEICFNSNANSFTIVDVTDKKNPSLVGSLQYEGLGYVHQGWLTEDHDYFLLGDEFDETNNDHNLRTYILDVRDLENPEIHTIYRSDYPSIDHNLFVKGHYVYQSNYTSGISILDISNIEEGNIKEVAFFDTYPANNKRAFKGSWGNYPFFDNGLVGVSDIQGGLFILKPRLP